LKAINPEARVLITVLDGGDRVVSEAFSEGAIGVLSMPLEIQRLAETVAQYVRPAPNTDKREAEPACAGKAPAARPDRSAAPSSKCSDKAAPVN
jgi:DNA-binding NtrC family response regulator